jgi:hypothetical protein
MDAKTPCKVTDPSQGAARAAELLKLFRGSRHTKDGSVAILSQTIETARSSPPSSPIQMFDPASDPALRPLREKWLLPRSTYFHKIRHCALPITTTAIAARQVLLNAASYPPPKGLEARRPPSPPLPSIRTCGAFTRSTTIPFSQPGTIVSKKAQPDVFLRAPTDSPALSTRSDDWRTPTGLLVPVPAAPGFPQP